MLIISLLQAVFSLPACSKISPPAYGIIRVYPFELLHAGWDPIPNAEGIRTNKENQSISIFFNGTKVYIDSQFGEEYGNADIYIDDEPICTTETSIYYGTSFSSADLPFGQHKVEIRPNPNNKQRFISLRYFSYRPHLLYECNCLRSYQNLTKSGTSWTQEKFQNSDNYIYSLTHSGGSFSYRKNCTRFWLSGIKGESYGTFKIKVSDGETEIISKEMSASTSNSTGDYYSVLLYESPVFELKEYEITFQSLSGKLAICDFIFSQQPKDAIVIYAKDMEIPTSYPKDRETLKLDDNGHRILRFSYYGGPLWVIGDRDDGSGPYSIDENGKTIYSGTATVNSNYFKQAILYADSLLNNQNHSMSIRYTGFGQYLFVYYVFYLNIPDPLDQPCNELGLDEFSSRFIESPSIFSEVNFSYIGFRFWLKGYVGPSNSFATISINNGKNVIKDTVSLYRENYNFSIFYSSPELPLGKHEVSVVFSDGKLANLSNVYYKPPPPTEIFSMSTSFTYSEYFTKSVGFTSSEYFTKSTGFTHSQSFTSSADFTYTDKFSQSEAFSKSIEFTTKYFTSSLSFSKSSQFSSSVLFSKSFELAPADPPAKHDNKSDFPISLIIGVVIGILVIAAIVIIVVFYLKRRRQQSSKGDTTAEANGTNIFTFSVDTNTVNDVDLDNDINSFGHDIFANPLESYEEDLNEAA